MKKLVQVIICIILSVTFSQSAPGVSNQVSNTDFSAGGTGWGLWNYPPANGAVNYTNGYALLDLSNHVDHDTLEYWAITWSHKNIALEAGKAYELSFDAWASSSTPIYVSVAEPWSDITQTQDYHINRKIPILGAVSESFAYPFLNFYRDKNTNTASIEFQVAKSMADSIYFDNVSLVEIDPLKIHSKHESGFSQNIQFFSSNNSIVLSSILTYNFTRLLCHTLQGKFIHSWDLIRSDNSQRIDVSGIPSGVFYFSLESEEQTLRKAVMINK